MLVTLLRIVLWLAGGVLVLMVTAMLVFLVPHSLYRRSREEILTGPDPGRRALVVYQPGLRRRTVTVARNLARGLNDAGYTVTLDRPGRHLPTDLSAYRVIAFGSPVYAGQASPALKRYLRSVTGYAAPVVLFTVGLDPDNDNTDQLAALVPAERIRRRLKFHRPEGDAAAARELGRTLGGE